MGKGQGLQRAGESGQTNLWGVAADFQLSTEKGTYHPVSQGEARKLPTYGFHRDLASDMEILPIADTEGLANDLVSHFGYDVSYYTNGSHGKNLDTKWASSGLQWTPATSATFDTGIVFVGARVSGVVWFEGED